MLSNLSRPVLWASIGVLVLAIAVVAYFSLNWNDDQFIETIEYSGNSLVQNQEVDSLTHKYIRQRIGEVSLEEIMLDLNALDFVKNVEVYRSGFNSLHIEIEELKPIAYFLEEERKVRILGENGKLYESRNLGRLSNLPIFYSERASLNRELLKKSASTIEALESSEELKLIMSEVVYLGNDQYKIVTSHGSLEVMLGKAEKLEEKTGRLMSFWKNYLVGIDPNGKTIDLRWGDKIVMY